MPAAVKTDGLSVVSLLKGGAAPKRDFFYWELHEGSSIQALRFGDWKAVKNGPDAKVELYDLKTDVSESDDLATAKPDLVAQAVQTMAAARVDDPNWPMVAKREGKGKKKQAAKKQP